MKFCCKCGEKLDDKVVFCPGCGVKLGDKSTNVRQWGQSVGPQGSKLPRKAMKAWSVVCFLFAGMYGLLSAVIEPAMLSAAVLFCVLGIMFVVLSKSPKENPYILGRDGGLTKKKFVWGSIMVGWIFCMVIALMVSAGTENGVTNQGEDSGVSTNADKAMCAYDVTQFANITGEQLIALLGEPDSIGNGKCNGSFEISCTNYDYDNLEGYGEASFTLVGDKVVRLTSYNEYKFSKVENIMKDFGVQKSKDAAKVANNENALRYRCPTETIDDFWISLIDEENKSFGFLQVTYDMEYYEEWYLPMTVSDKTNYQLWTQETVKKLLKSPKSADFPNVTQWNIVKNKYYTGVQSYVDAQNSFGANMRSEFTFIYNTSNQVVYAIFDGKVILNEGYIKTEELVKKSIGK